MQSLVRNSILALAAAFLLAPVTADGYSANKVLFMFKPYGGYRVYVNYTVPELKEYREAYVEFVNKKAAEKYYWDLVRGADFYLPEPESIRFTNKALEPEPW
jgi:hypothetical protein